MGDFLRWLIGDITKEEMDVMVENGLEPKDVNKYISTKARVWFMSYVNTVVDWLLFPMDVGFEYSKGNWHNILHMNEEELKKRIWN